MGVTSERCNLRLCVVRLGKLPELIDRAFCPSPGMQFESDTEIVERVIAFPDTDTLDEVGETINATDDVFLKEFIDTGADRLVACLIIAPYTGSSVMDLEEMKDADLKWLAGACLRKRQRDNRVVAIVYVR